MNGNKIRLYNGIDYLQEHLEQIYGERGSFEHNLQRYVESKYFLSKCRRPSKIEDIPEITFKDIMNICEEEQYFHNLCNNVLNTYDVLKQTKKITDEDYLQLGGILGVCPGDRDWTEVIFPFLLDLFVSCDSEGFEIEKQVYNNIPILRLIVDELCIYLKSGMIFNIEDRTVWSQGYARNLFRGENAYYKKSIPSMFRKSFTSKNEADKYRLLQVLKIAEFSLWIRSFESIKGWPYSDLFDSAIAQHYGLKTSYLDVTSNIKTALFFACSKYDYSNNRWLMLEEADYSYADTRKDISAMGGDARFGIIHKAPADISMMSMLCKNKKYDITYAYPIGYMPFLRCSNQNGYIVKGTPDYDMFYDPAFCEFKFRHSPEICEWIFSEMNEGKTIYPNEWFDNFSDVLNQIDNSREFSINAFNTLMQYWKTDAPNLDEDYYRKMLAKSGIVLLEKIDWCDMKRRNELEIQCAHAIHQFD